MSKLPIISGIEAIKAFSRAGWTPHRQVGIMYGFRSRRNLSNNICGDRFSKHLMLMAHLLLGDIARDPGHIRKFSQLDGKRHGEQTHLSSADRNNDG